MLPNPRSFKDIKRFAKEAKCKSRGEVLRGIQQSFRKKGAEEKPAPKTQNSTPKKKTTQKKNTTQKKKTMTQKQNTKK